MEVLMKRLLLSLIIISSWLIPQPIYAATEDLTVASEGSCTVAYTQPGTYIGGAADYTNLNDSSDATYLQSTSGVYNVYDCYRCYNMSDFTTSYSSINSVSITFRSGGTYRVDQSYIIIGGTRYAASTTHRSYGVENWTDTWVTNPATGTDWTDTAINDAKYGVLITVWNDLGTYTSQGDNLYELKVTVNYTAPTAPLVTTTDVTSNSTTSSTLNGIITSDGGDTITDYGFVWGTVSKADPGNTAPSATTYTANYEIGAGTYSTGAITHSTGATLTANTTYYYRAAAYNSVGWAYGDEESFKTVGNPSISTLATINIATTTATLKAQVTDANGQLCDVRFGYGTTSQANVTAYTTQTAWVNDTYTTGDFPTAAITGLTAATLYYCRVEIKNDAGTVQGSELSFTTYSGIDEPVSITIIPGATTLSISWVKGTGASETLIRKSTGTYPATTADGDYVYLGTGNSVLLTGLTSGATYYISGWGKTAALYSTNKTTQLSTTLAYSTVASTLATPDTPGSLYQEPSDAKISGMPIVGALVTIVSDEYEIPVSMVYYLFLFVVAVIVGTVIYGKTKEPWMTVIPIIIILAAGVTMEIIALLVVLLFAIVAISIMVVSQRR